MNNDHSVKKPGRSRKTETIRGRLSPVAMACTLFYALCANPVLADTINYTGNMASLQAIPTGYGIVSGQTQVLFPGTGTPVNDNNTVTVNVGTGGAMPNYVYGGVSSALNSSSGGNTVDIVKGTVLNDVTGGYAYSENTSTPPTIIYAETVGNKVTLGNGTLTGGFVYGGNASASGSNLDTGAVNVNADSNDVALSGASVQKAVYGGSSTTVVNTSGLVNAGTEFNSVAIEGNSNVFGNVYAGYVNARNNGSGNITANSSDNTVKVSGSTLTGDVYGGSARADSINGSVTVTSSNNVVTIADSKVSGDVYGGYVEGLVQPTTGFTVNAESINNMVNISGNSDFSVNTTIYGGLVDTGTDGTIPPGSNAFTGNTLNISTSGIKIKQVANFENYNFMLPSSTTNGTVMIETSDGADVTGSKVAVTSIAPGVALASGDKVYLLKTAGLTGSATLTNASNVSQGYSLNYDLTLAQDANDIFATVTGASVNPKTSSFLEGRLAGLALVTQGADMVADQGMSSAIAAAEQQEGRLTVFGTVSGGTSRYDTGSHIDLDGFGLMAGVSGKQDNLTGAVFVEGGWGSYDSHNNFSNGSVHGDGDTHYYGIGLLGRATLKNGLYLDGSFRIGKTSTDYTGKDYLDSAGNQAHFKSKVTYVSAHAGVGYMMPLNSVTDLDVSAKYLWSRQGSDSVTVGSDPVNFDAENSQRLRGMAKVLQKVSPQLAVTGALGYEYEFDGKAKGTVHHMYGIDSPSLEGGSGIGEIGLEYTPQGNQRLSLEAKLAGYVGQREGVSGLVRLNYAF